MTVLASLTEASELDTWAGTLKKFHILQSAYKGEKNLVKISSDGIDVIDGGVRFRHLGWNSEKISHFTVQIYKGGEKLVKNFTICSPKL